VVVPVVPVATDSVPPSAHVRLKGFCTFQAPSGYWLPPVVSPMCFQRSQRYSRAYGRPWDCPCCAWWLSTILVRRSYHSGGALLGRSGRARPSCLHISDYGLPAVIDMDVLDADILVSAVAEAAKGLHLHRIGPH
jgi:hypothetical protein